jgi:hypothetical protein
MKHVENRRLEAKGDDETSGNAEFSGIEKETRYPRDKLVFLDLQVLDFGVEPTSGTTTDP